MKYAIPVVALLLIGVGVHLRRSGAEGSPPAEGLVPRKSADRGPLVEARDQEEVPSAPQASSPSKVGSTAGPAPRTVVPESSWAKLQGRLDRQVVLSGDQRVVLGDILRGREEEIRRYHDRLREAGVVELSQFDWETGLMKDRWFRMIDAQLDRPQHERFLALVQQGFLNVGVDFPVEPGMVVID